MCDVIASVGGDASLPEANRRQFLKCSVPRWPQAG
jgi:hypothetical protein